MVRRLVLAHQGAEARIAHADRFRADVHDKIAVLRAPAAHDSATVTTVMLFGEGHGMLVLVKFRAQNTYLAIDDGELCLLAVHALIRGMVGYPHGRVLRDGLTSSCEHKQH